ncbi:MAG: type II toxin-antitoxin system PemK/MazF family toxin [Candidatus Diapherotrites archaeon]|nr:type II toxin-antitoxin system PemK/MazF family toxin [Candidatus Diapherotrites archaeon]
MYEPGDVVLAYLQYADSQGIKQRPAVVLYEEQGNIVVAGITSNPHRVGVPITTEEGMMVDSIIRTNYIFTTVDFMVKKRLFKLSKNKKREVYSALKERLGRLIE